MYQKTIEALFQARKNTLQKSQQETLGKAWTNLTIILNSFQAEKWKIMKIKTKIKRIKRNKSVRISRKLSKSTKMKLSN